jgi:hypothetical protein
MPPVEDPRFPGPYDDPSEAFATLRYCAVIGDVEMAKPVIEAGADVNEQVRHGDTPLLTACGNGQAAMARLLLDAKANPNLTQGARDMDASPLMHAATWGSSPEICDMLLAAGADPDHKCRNGLTAWDYVIQMRTAEKREKMMAYFTEKGLDGDPRPPCDRMMEDFPQMVDIIKAHAGVGPLAKAKPEVVD